MATYKTRISRAAEKRGRVILANDHDGPPGGLESRTIRNIERLHGHVCGIKLNLHLLLPLGAAQVKNITGTAHRFGLQVIADIKLNDIGNTNRIAAERLWAMGFDCVIANPVMGLESLKELARSARRRDKGVVALCHMSAPEARISYEMGVGRGKKRLYEVFLEWALKAGVDGIVVGATFPNIIKECAKAARGRLEIYSPGVGTQGGSARAVLAAGSDYMIVGRSILGARDPAGAARRLQAACLD